jgi:hypothetical protein
VILRGAIDREAHRLVLLHGERLRCRQGCSGCCVDGLTVFEVEAEPIRRHHADLLRTGTPHARGACAFLDDEGGCRVYADRPYVCRTQGLPLRWIDRREGEPVELRDVCPLNDAGEPIEGLPIDACWTLGPVEERLASLELARGVGATRTPLRALFEHPPDDGSGQGDADRPASTSEPHTQPQAVITMGDKSPKAKDRAKKQDTAGKDQKKAAAVAKAAQGAVGAAKKGR